MSADVRASELREGQTFAEYGDDDAIKITLVDYHGDRVLITGTSADGDSVERSYDIDEVVELNPEEGDRK